MTRGEFVKRFGGVFEHSPWVAERGYDLIENRDGLTAGCVHAALVRAFRAASADELTGVLRAHPDLAGRLALAGELTQSSRCEQASAGLDRLTAKEHALFVDLNERYQSRFGFPFIIAVSGLGKHAVLQAFQQRISNSEADERETASREVEKIAWIRLAKLLPED